MINIDRNNFEENSPMSFIGKRDKQSILNYKATHPLNHYRTITNDEREYEMHNPFD